MGALRRLAAVALLCAAALADESDKTIFAVLKSSGALANFYELVLLTSSVRKLLDNKNKGPYTVFAPNKAAFQQSSIKYDKMPDDALEDL